MLPAATAALAIGCVIVSSSTQEPPREDASTEPVDSGPRPDVSDTRDAGGLTRAEATRALLVSIGERVVLPTYRELATETEALVAATQAHASAPSDDTRAAAQDAWRSTMVVVERAELLQLGPGGMAGGEVTGGRGLREAMYAWPSFNRCRIDVATQSGVYEDLETLRRQGPYMLGLGAIEYLLFEPSADHDCDPGAAVTVDPEAWAALGESGVRARRAAHAHALAQLVDRAADALLAAWAPEGGAFVTQLATAGEGSTVYPMSQDGLNAIFHAMFYLDRQIKDSKLGAPASINDRCESESCPELLESRYAHRSSEHILPNLQAFQALFLGAPEGTDAIGFDDLLLTVGATELEADMRTKIAAAVALAAALPPVDATTFAAHVDEYAAMYAAVKAITDLFKAEFRTVLALELPMGAAEDND
ncbi:imelysin family protein [Sandaracinus amylolyticus]|uniref:Iron-regulated protein A n=1 Tax=Sandaracinus amylolyticus TaxID=927083 RepID=A0A0F6SGQ2_9BACT|nr:imelysin family protein [Sandaracinus amylolyticus]AKF09089.1 Iron-regulated protein A precursor [Sandaracinus amylolyticus]